MRDQEQQEMFLLSSSKKIDWYSGPVVVNLDHVPRDTLRLLQESVSSTVGGDVTGAGLILTRGRGLPPIITVTDVMKNRPEFALGLISRLGYLVNRRFNERD